MSLTLLILISSPESSHLYAKFAQLHLSSLTSWQYYHPTWAIIVNPKIWHLAVCRFDTLITIDYIIYKKLMHMWDTQVLI